jgi:hypothetical protein
MRIRRTSSIGAMAAVFSVAVIALAAASPLASASPSPSAHPSASPRPSASPTASPKPAASPAPSASPSPSTTGATTFSSQVLPLQIRGSAKVVEHANGSGTVTLRVSGLLDAQHWTVDIDGGTVALPNEKAEIASKAGADVTRLAMDTVRIRLTKAEMTAFMRARDHGGVVAEVSDGTRVGYAEFTAG